MIIKERDRNSCMPSGAKKNGIIEKKLNGTLYIKMRKPTQTKVLPINT